MLYKGMNFEPHRKMTKEEKKLNWYQIIKYFNFRIDPSITEYNYTEFFYAMNKAVEDIFLCTDNGKYYMPCENYLFIVTY